MELEEQKYEESLAKKVEKTNYELDLRTVVK